MTVHAWFEQETYTVSGFDNSNTSVEVLAAGSDRRIWRILFGADADDIVLIKVGGATVHRIFTDISMNGNLDFGNKPIPVPAGSNVVLEKVNDATTPIAWYIDYTERGA